MKKSILCSAMLWSLACYSFADSELMISGPLTSTFAKYYKPSHNFPYCKGGNASGWCMEGDVYGYPIVSYVGPQLSSLQSCTILIGFRLPSQNGAAWHPRSFLATTINQWSGTNFIWGRWGEKKSYNCSDDLKNMGTTFGVAAGASPVGAQDGNGTTLAEIDATVAGAGICQVVGVWKGIVNINANAMTQPAYQAYTCGNNQPNPPTPKTCIASVPSSIDLGTISTTQSGKKNTSTASVWCSDDSTVSFTFFGSGGEMDLTMGGGVTARLKLCDAAGACGVANTPLNMPVSGKEQTSFSIQSEIVGSRFDTGTYQANTILMMSYQ